MYFRPVRLLKSIGIFLLFIIVIYQIYHLLRRHPTIKTVVKRRQAITPLSLSSDTEFDEVSHTLEPFTIALPQFADDEARDWFYKSSYYKINSKRCPNNSCVTNGVLFDDMKEHLAVHVALIKNGLYINDDCGYNYGDTAIRRTFKSSSEASVIYDKAIIYTVPDGWSFQHFLDGIGPKLSHSRAYLDKYPDAKVIILKGVRFDRSVKEIWEMLGVKEADRIIRCDPSMKLGARLMINPCRTPGIHPRLWQDARALYWSLVGLPTSEPVSSKGNLIYIQRTSSNAMNSGRLIINETPFIEILREYASKHSLTYVQYDHSKDGGHIRKQIELFYNARIIIGVHGGAHSNINFAPSGTTVIEVMPYRSDESSLPVVCFKLHLDELKPCVGYIYYTQSQLLNQSYWILPTVVNNDNNLNVSLTRVQKIFDSLV